MGWIVEGQIRDQAKKAQGETNDRLEAMIAAQRETNRLLALLLHVMTGQAPPPPPR